RELVRAIATRSDVAHVDANDWVRSAVLPTAPVVPAPASGAPTGIEWNVKRVNAPAVWRHGLTGQGIVVGEIDTGFQWDHTALKSRCRGWNGVTAYHNYNWLDEGRGTPARVDPSARGAATLGRT